MILTPILDEKWDEIKTLLEPAEFDYLSFYIHLERGCRHIPYSRLYQKIKRKLSLIYAGQNTNKLNQEQFMFTDQEKDKIQWGEPITKLT